MDATRGLSAHSRCLENLYPRLTRDNPRAKNRNAVVLAVPDRSGLDAARSRIRDYLGWEEVQELLKNQELDTFRKKRLEENLKESKTKIPNAVEQAYCIVVTVAENNDIQAFKVSAVNHCLI